VKEVRQNIEQK